MLMPKAGRSGKYLFKNLAADVLMLPLCLIACIFWLPAAAVVVCYLELCRKVYGMSGYISIAWRVDE